MWKQARNWGHVFTAPGIIGMLLLMMADGPDMVRAGQQNSMTTITVLMVVMIAFFAVGWFINHFPTQPTPVRLRRDWDQYDPE